MTATDGAGWFAQLLRHYRATAGLSQEELAERAGLSRRGVSDLERGERRSPHPDTVRRLAEGLGLDAVERSAFIASARPAAAIVDLDEPSLLPLPVPPTSFIGRGRDLAEVRRLLVRHRLLTLTGAGGSGKTRLALETAGAHAAAYPDGTALVLLAPVADPRLVAPSIAHALGVRQNPLQPLRETLVAYLHPRRLLLLLDNFEHVVDAAPLVADLLGACPDLTVLVTSREPLRLREEREFSVPPLELPRADRDTPAAELLQCGSVELFGQRVAHVVPDFRVTATNVRTIADICLRLDGLPLAIELAAARAKVLSPALLLERLKHPLPILVGGARDLPSRQRTLRDTIAWSHDLLVPSDQRLFRQLAVFAGGCTVATAEAACDTEANVGRSVLDGLASLVDKNLIRRQDGPDGEPRFVMLETIREFALEQLSTSGELEAVSERHADHFMALAERGERALLTGRNQVHWLGRLEREHDNLRGALRWADGHGAVDMELRLASALAYFWNTFGDATEGRSRLASALAHGHAATPVVRAKGLAWAAFLAILQGDLAAVPQMLDEVRPLTRDSDGPLLPSMLLTLRAFLAQALGRHGESVELLEEAIALVKAHGIKPMGMLRWQHATALLSLGQVEESARLHEETLADALASGDTYAAGAVLADLGTIALIRREPKKAANQFREALGLARQLGDVMIPALCLEGLAAAAAVQGRPRDVALLIGAVDRLSVRMGIPMPGAEGRTTDARRQLPAHMTAAHLIAEARAALGDAAFAAAREAGRTLRLDQVIAQAFDDPEPLEASADGITRLPARLTPSETKVLCLIATGNSNREIADQLARSVRTVERHITNLYGKIGARGKADATAYAFRHKLIAQ